jgi:putative restriction endonuclease
VKAFGVARSHAYEAPKPEEFGSTGRNWDKIGWRVEVSFHRIRASFRPADWIEQWRPLLPERYSPLQRDGRGVQAIYLTELPRPLAHALADLAGTEVAAIARVEMLVEASTLAPATELTLWEEHLREGIERNSALGPTEKEALVLSRRGQGLFRERVQELESRCRITRVDRVEHLRASHIKPWRDSSNAERLSGANGLLLTPSIDHLFDRGFISFSDDGRLLVSPVAHYASLQRMGIAAGSEVQVGAFAQEQAGFLEYHRDQVFLRSQRRGVG